MRLRRLDRTSVFVGYGSSWRWSMTTPGCGAVRQRLRSTQRARRWYEPHLERIHEDAPARQADLLQLEQIATGYASRERFLTELTLDPPDATSD
jgi:DNA helicase-2/ATP-dependent DNA helicase PcrA